MAKQLNLLETGQIIPTALHTEMERSYLEYAMSVIVGRALPDVRDGLKPVHRRILYAMHELGLTPDRPYRKCARVVGDVLGKYHPHGDQAVYDALVRMVQEFSSRYPLLSGHGNFGSVDNDPPAAMRYTETRLAAIAQDAMLTEIGEATVDYASNFDNSQQEPVVLPAQLPLLLLNGCAGIAVGMATNIPPHNLGEIVDGLIALIDKPDLADEKLWELIPGPDFPTGGEIVAVEGLRETYATGRGIIPVRGVARIERMNAGKKRRKEIDAIIVTELPYQVNKAGWIEKVAELVNQTKIEGIADIRDESDREGMRVVIETKRDANAKTILEQLYRQTALQTNFGAIMLALVNNKPCQLTLRELLQEFLQFREQTLTRRYSYELEQAQRRIHLVQGLLSALSQLDATIEILRNAADGTTAKMALQERLDLSETQADSILAMPLRRLTGLERQKLKAEYEELQGAIARLQLLLGDRGEFLKVLKKDLRALKRKFGDERRTRIVRVRGTGEGETRRGGDEERGRRGEGETQLPAKGKRKKEEDSLALELEIEVAPRSRLPEAAVVEVSRKGGIYLHAAPPVSDKMPSKGEDAIVFREAIAGRETFVAVTENGKAYPVALNEVPITGKAVPLIKYLPASVQSKREATSAYFFVPEDLNAVSLVLLSQQGKIKRLAATELGELSNRGAMLMKLKEGDRAIYLGLAREGDEVAIATSGGRILRLAIDEMQLPLMGRSAQGNQATRLRVGEEVVGCAVLRPEQNLFLVTRMGFAKRIPLSAIRLAQRSDIGTQALQFSEKGDRLASLVLCPSDREQITIVTTSQRAIALPVKSIGLWGKDGCGDRVPKLKADEQILEAIAVWDNRK
ncbi:DNA topoisomerase (ATP-hydrolyzing) [Oscillatoria sp. FACHB-1406]|uniref:DNA gyrase/topoisomerase IV subunit A n=1 Tax=Oscillatoria sp. FACHB-1406 TaxID=2692846 RepID=UPI0016889DC0|nr:DNA topoisomerase (ATP-hydrolyzing) [Oscillatoria sp. FACHB-1406]MBD2578848.1 DNA topoisomerase 4 subunit A [Oscillatoria sp. FACHB-1406]